MTDSSNTPAKDAATASISTVGQLVESEVESALNENKATKSGSPSVAQQNTASNTASASSSGTIIKIKFIRLYLADN